MHQKGGNFRQDLEGTHILGMAPKRRILMGSSNEIYYSLVICRCNKIYSVAIFLVLLCAIFSDLPCFTAFEACQLFRWSFHFVWRVVIRSIFEIILPHNISCFFTNDTLFSIWAWYTGSFQCTVFVSVAYFPCILEFIFFVSVPAVKDIMALFSAEFGEFVTSK